MNARGIAVEILEKSEARPGQLELIIAQSFKADIDRRDKRFVQELVYGVVRRQLALNFIIEHFLDNKRYCRDAALMRLLRIGAYQIIHMDRVPDHAAVNETVKLAKRDPRTKHIYKMVNAVLRALLANKGRLPQPGEQTGLIRRLSIQFSWPEWLVEHWISRFGLDKTRKLLAFFNERPSLYIRRRIKGISRQQFESENRQICDPVGGFMNLYYRLTKPIAPDNLRSLEHGFCTVQAPSGGWVAALLGVQAGESVLDVCAAPGGKATLLAELVGRDGAVCSCEYRFSRMQRLVENAVRLNLINMFAVVCDGRTLPLSVSFNKVLIDAPCSGTGVMHRHPDARWVKKKDDFNENARLQSQLLEGVARHVVPGGILVYATCSLEREENEDQIHYFLQRHPEFVVDPAPREIPPRFIDDAGFLHITPYEHNMDGMFGARLKRVK